MKLIEKIKAIEEFDWACLKLTLFYCFVIMLLSVSFSVAFYRISASEIDRGLGRQGKILRELLEKNRLPEPLAILEQARLDQVEEANNRIVRNLIYYNLIILIIASVGSYFFAKKTLKPIKESVLAQNRFTADASHELRTPLTAMKTEIEVNLRDEKLNIVDARALLKSNLEEILKLENLSNALLKLARSESKERENFENIPITLIISASISRVRNLATIKNIQFISQLDREADSLLVCGDQERLVDLFIIFLDNAIKYSPKNSKIEISMKKYDGNALVLIKDHGIGIDPNELPHVFDRFYRADSSRNKERVSGYGLGLAIAKSIVDLHRGTISVKSKLGQGSEFIVALPLKF